MLQKTPLFEKVHGALARRTFSEATVPKMSSRGSSAGRLFAHSGTILAPFRYHFGSILRYFSDHSGPYPKHWENNAPQNHLVIRNVRVQLNLGLGRPSKESIIYLLECAQGGKGATTDSHRLFALGRRDDFNPPRLLASGRVDLLWTILGPASS